MSKNWIALALCLGVAVAVVGGHIQAQQIQPRADQERDLEFSLYMVEGLRTQEPSALPDDLASVMAEVRAIHPYGAYRLLDTNVMRKSLTAEGSLSGVLPTTAKVLDNATPYYSLAFRGGAFGDDLSEGLSIGNLDLTAQTPYPKPTIIGDRTLATTDWRSTGFTVDVDADLGEKVLIGKINVAGERTHGRPSNAIFFILEVIAAD